MNSFIFLCHFEFNYAWWDCSSLTVHSLVCFSLCVTFKLSEMSHADWRVEAVPVLLSVRSCIMSLSPHYLAVLWLETRSCCHQDLSRFARTASYHECLTANAAQCVAHVTLSSVMGIYERLKFKLDFCESKLYWQEQQITWSRRS